MQPIEVTDEQYAYIEQLRAALQEQMVGRYGTCLDRDAIQFLIDNLDEDLDLEETFDAAPLPDGTQLQFSEDGSADAGASDAPGSGPDGEDDSRGDTTSTDDGNGDAASDADDAPTAENADDDAMLDEMMNLLETHDDKWAESPAGDYRYRVDLPEGGTEDVQTKDDVRAILFKEYR